MRLLRMFAYMMMYAASALVHAAATLENELPALVDEARYRPSEALLRLSALETQLPKATPAQQAQYLMLLALAQASSSKPDLATANAQQLLQLAKTSSSPDMLALAYLTQAKVLTNIGNRAEASKAARAAEEGALQSHDLALRSEILTW